MSSGLHGSVLTCATGILSEDHRSQLYVNILKYLFRMHHQKHIRAWINANSVPFDFKAWRESLHTNGELLTTCKIYTYYRAVLGVPKPGQIPITHEDREACLIALRESPELVDYLRKLSTERDFAPLNTETFSVVIGAVLDTQDLRAFCGSLVSRRLHFIYSNYSVTAEELIAELRNTALVALYKTYPMFGSIGQMLAIAKAAMNNKAVNIIEAYTSAKAAHWERDNTGKLTTSRELSIQHSPDALDIIIQGENVENSNLAVDLFGTPTASLRPYSGAWDEIQQSPMFTKLEKKFLALLSGEYSESFSTFLKKNNTEASDSGNPAVYRRNVEKFLGITSECSGKALDKARTFFIV